MKVGDLVKWTFFYTSGLKKYKETSELGILIKTQELPIGSWIVLLESGSLMHADISELELIHEEK